MATVEYAALVVVVSAVLLVGGAAVDARALPGAVGAQLQRAYCIVAGGDCLGRGGPRPCVVRWGARSRELRVAVLVGRLRDGRIVLREERSDGTVRVAVTQSSGAGVAMLFGFAVQVASREMKVGGEAEAGGDVGYGRSFVVADAAAADRLIARLNDEDAPAGGAVPGLLRFLRERGREGEAERVATFATRGEAEAALGALGLGPRVSALRGLTAGVRVDQRTGDRTLLLRFGGEAVAALAAPLGRLSGGRTSATAVELTLDAARRPVALVVRGSEGIHGEAELVTGGRAGGDLREAEARLDLTDPVARALAGRFMDGDVGAARALAARLADRARVDVRHFATTREEKAVGGSLKALGGLGGEMLTMTETARLVAAEGREPGLGWSRNLECLLSA